MAVRAAGYAAIALCATASPALAQDRTDDNAITQAEDAFGFSVGRETIGIYNSGNTRGFSPTSAGNVRIDGLYFDPAAPLTSIVIASSSIKVGLSAQGYPFAAPSGIVDYSLRRPDAKTGASIVLNGDSYGSAGVEIDGTMVLSTKLAIGYGLTGNHTAYSDGTTNWTHGEGLIARWRPTPDVEIIPFWTLFNDYDDEAGEFYLPAGKFLPPIPPQRHYDGPQWADIRFTGSNHGVLASVTPAKDWLVRLAAFRSVADTRTAFANLLLDEQPDGTGDLLTVADPRLKNVSLSGEARITHSIAEGPRLHVFHLSLRERNARHQFGGSAEIDLGPSRIGEPDRTPEPAFQFGAISRDRVRQTTVGVAYDGRWKNLGEISFSVSRAFYRKTIALADTPDQVTRSRPWLYNATAAINIMSRLTAYAGYARGLEESGIAPASAANRNQPLPAILTEQKDAGLRLTIARDIKLIVGVFDLRRPYFGFDAGNAYTQVGAVRSRGIEFSVAGNLTPRLNIVAGGDLLDPVVTRDASATGTIGRRPAGLASHLLNLNLDWRTPIVDGLSFDLAVVHRGNLPATTDNSVSIPPRARFDLGGRYQFKLAHHDATFRLQMSNVFNSLGLGYAAPGVYTSVTGRYLTGYLAIDI